MPNFFNSPENYDSSCNSGSNNESRFSSITSDNQALISRLSTLITPVLWMISSAILSDSSRRALNQCFSNNNITGNDLVSVQSCWPVASTVGRDSAVCGTNYEYDAFTLSRCGAMFYTAELSQTSNIFAIIAILLPMISVMSSIYQRSEDFINPVRQSAVMFFSRHNTRNTVRENLISDDADSYGSIERAEDRNDGVARNN